MRITTWSRPKPLIAVRSNLLSIAASNASAAASRAALPLAVGRSIAIEPARSSRSIASAAARAPATASLSGSPPPSTSITVSASVSSIVSRPPGKSTWPVRASSSNSLHPASSSASASTARKRRTGQGVAAIASARLGPSVSGVSGGTIRAFSRLAWRPASGLSCRVISSRAGRPGLSDRGSCST